MRTIVYIHGFNLYYRALQGTSHKGLDVAAMSRAALPACRGGDRLIDCRRRYRPDGYPQIFGEPHLGPVFLNGASRGHGAA